MSYKVREWDKFKHFKDRNAPWVKLNKDLLSSRDWFDLPADTAKALVMLWLIASEDPEREGSLPDLAELAFRLRMNETEVQKHLGKLGRWLEQTGAVEDTSVSAVMQTDNVSISEQKPKYTTKTTASKKPDKKRSRKNTYAKHEYSRDFQEFWRLYPKKMAKPKVYEKFMSVTKTVAPSLIIAGLRSQLENTFFTEDPKHFTFADTWLNQSRWEKEAP